MSAKRKCISIALLSILAIAALFLLLPERASTANKSKQTSQATGAIPSGWKQFKGKSGMSVSLPPAWKIEETEHGTFQAFRPSKGGGATAIVVADRIEAEGHSTSVLGALGQMYPALLPAVKVSSVKQIVKKPDVAISRIDYIAGGKTFQGSVMCVITDKKGSIYIMASEAAGWKKDRQILSRILQSYTSPDAQAMPPVKAKSQRYGIPQMLTWQDPFEKAFTCPVPKGWSVEGGLKRFASVDTRPEVMVISPDRNILIRMGDAFISRMVLPNPLLAEGRPYSPGYGVVELVLRYLPSVSYAIDYYLPQHGIQPMNVQARDFPEISQRLQANSGMPARVDTAEATFDAQVEGQPKKGYVFVGTTLMMPGSPASLWMVNDFYIYLATPGYEDLAAAVLNRMVAGVKFSPQWVAGEIKTAGAVSGIVSKSSNETSNIIQQTFKNREASEERIHERRTRAIRGETLVEDPVTGERFEAPAGGDRYYRQEGTNVGITTEAGVEPPQGGTGVWFRELEKLE